MIYQPPKYVWSGKTTYKVGAQVVGERLEELAQNGPVTPHRVVEDATPKDSPLHTLFEWDNKSAANNYRVIQARQVIRSVAVVYETTEAKETKIQAFLSVSPEEGRSYMASRSVLSDEELRTQFFNGIVKELHRLKEKMSQFQEFSDVVNAIEQLAA
jgi:hypothetical protein